MPPCNHDHRCVACDKEDNVIVIAASPLRVDNQITILICASCLADDVNAKVVATAILERLTQ